MEVSNELKPYIPVVDMIAETFGKDCEVVLHDLSFPRNSVVYVVNGHVTGRQIGQPIHHLFTVVLKSKEFRNDFLCNYSIKNVRGEEIKSSTALLRNSNGTVIGALCINFDTTAVEKLQDFINNFLVAPQTISSPQPDGALQPVNNIEVNGEEMDSVIEIANDLIKKIIGSANVKSLKRQQKIELIEFMESKGIFMIKGSIETVASLMKISTVTVYSYLDEIRKRSNK